MARLSSLLSPLPPFILASLAFAFTIVTITSRDWAHQKHYDPSLDMKDWKTPLYSIYRSPFKICEITKDISSNNVTIYSLNCNTFDAYGFDKTSCEVVFATQDYSTANTGDERLCQQVHRAGNLAITSTTFISLGFVLTLLMTILSYTTGTSSSSSAEAPTAEGAEAQSKPEPNTQHATHHRHYPSYTPMINLFLVVSFSIAAITALLSQFYGILAFIQSQPDNGAFASARGNVNDPTQDNSHGPWIEGYALKAWVTCAWVFSAFTAGAAASVWRLPRWEKVV